MKYLASPDTRTVQVVSRVDDAAAVDVDNDPGPVSTMHNSKDGKGKGRSRGCRGGRSGSHRRMSGGDLDEAHEDIRNAVEEIAGEGKGGKSAKGKGKGSKGKGKGGKSSKGKGKAPSSLSWNRELEEANVHDSVDRARCAREDDSDKVGEGMLAHSREDALTASSSTAVDTRADSMSHGNVADEDGVVIVKSATRRATATTVERESVGYAMLGVGETPTDKVVPPKQERGEEGSEDGSADKHPDKRKEPAEGEDDDDDSEDDESDDDESSDESEDESSDESSEDESSDESEDESSDESEGADSDESDQADGIDDKAKVAGEHGVVGAQLASGSKRPREESDLAAAVSETRPCSALRSSAAAAAARDSCGTSNGAMIASSADALRGTSAAALTDASPGASMVASRLAVVEGLPELMAHLSHATQLRALQWCEAEDAASVTILVLAGRSDAFVRALHLKPGGCNEVVVRQRLAELSGQGGTACTRKLKA